MQPQSSNGNVILRPRWRGLWKRIGAKRNGDAVFQQLLDLYGDPARAYHTIAHVAHCLLELDDARAMARTPDAVETALWFHDAIYLPLCTSSSEERSAWLAKKVLSRAGVAVEFVTAVADLIRATDHRTRLPDREDAELIADIDLAILGRPEPEFDAYEEGIRFEYQRVPEEIFRMRRAAILEELLARECIYRTHHFHRKYGAPARANLECSIARLRAAQ